MAAAILSLATTYGAQVALTVALILIVRFFHEMFKVRLLFYRLRKQGLPMPQWDFAAGNLRMLPDLMKRHPKGSQQSEAFTLLSYEFPNNDNCFYIDVWPFTKPLLVVTSPDLAVQASQTYALPKPPVLAEFFNPFTGGPSIFVTNGPEWKHARGLFNPAFSASNILEHTPYIVEEAEVYVEILREHARKGDMFTLDKMTCDYVMDIIGYVAMKAHLHSQRRHNAVAAAMRSSVEWHCQDEQMNPFIRWNPMRPLMQWYNGRTMNRYIGIELDKRYEVWRQQSSTRANSIIDIVLAEFMSTRTAGDELDPEFKKWATIQIRTFLFAGHDSTAATIVYSIYLLSKHPERLAKVRSEHDEMFGSDITTAADKLKQHPELINRLPYTLAVIKETLRLFPAASALREGQPGVYLQDKNGTKYPTDGLCIWILHTGLQRNPNYWPDPHAFKPERWLVGPEDPLYPPKGAWRPFEHGPRDCIGQPLALLDIKITLVLTLREFDFQDQYAEWDRLHPRPGPKTVFGERAYQIPLGGSHPADGLPCRVSFRKQTSQ
ncbi:cytochrome protein [Aspergillus pseudonomiae]|uniref:Cytochrome protein n=1 Tax=Aspergillus pseudonomiae TaxID=1506151 RepID=A0A5N7CXE5_9EURO|nr:cytochrome protein [Aspergillus pseudonomiae]KAE8398860.1 cytochrome protein [Aspergillus pseudonomiae]